MKLLAVLLLIALVPMAVPLPGHNMALSGVALARQLQPTPGYDEQLGETFTQNFSVLSINVTAVQQEDSNGYGPAYLLNGLSSAGYWYQVGLAYNWPNTNGGYTTGFSMVYEVWNSSGTSAFPSSGGGLVSFSGPVNPGDEIQLSLQFSGGYVTMQAYDWNTGASAIETYSAEGASYFQGLPSEPSNQDGFFTGIMTEWYHSEPYYGNEQQVTYLQQRMDSAWLWVSEFNTANSGAVFYSSTSSPVNLSSTLYQYAADGAVEYASRSMFITGLVHMSLASFSAVPVVTDAGMPAVADFNISVSGGLEPYTYSVYLGNGTRVYSVTLNSSNFSTSLNLGNLSPGSYFYYVQAADSYGETVNSSIVTVKINPDPSLFVLSSKAVTDVGLHVTINSSVSLGTPPYNYAWYVNGSKVGIYQNFTFVPDYAGNYSISAVVTDSAGYTLHKNITTKVNPDPTVLIMLSRQVIDRGMNVTFNVKVNGGTQPYSYLWYIGGKEVNPNASFTFTSAGNYTVEASIADSAGFRVNNNATVHVNADPIISALMLKPYSTSIFYTVNRANMTVQLAGGTPPYRYTWYINGKNVSVTGVPSYTYQLPTGEYTLQVKAMDSAGYSLTSKPVTVSSGYDYFSIAAIAATLVVAAVLLLRKLTRDKI
ncbi:MAG: PKD domain-containing protein [Nitrososphaerota archaeon]|jgi:hypothetical protein|nr:PKD domain-containing protein [Nitrososphaerota archaeon]